MPRTAQGEAPRRRRAGRTALATFLVATLTTSFLIADGDAHARSYPRLFGSSEQKGGGLTVFPKWVGALERSARDRTEPENCIEGSQFKLCHLQAWDAFVEGLRGKNRLAQIRAVNAEMNRRRYIIDPVNWGLDDYWATPLQFFKKQGDCEDYAISKFLTLRALGVPNEDLRIVVLLDTNLELAHAVLVVYLEGTAYVLDNQIDSVVRAETVRHYRPIYSINETTWWLHKPQG